MHLIRFRLKSPVMIEGLFPNVSFSSMFKRFHEIVIKFIIFHRGVFINNFNYVTFLVRN